MRLPSSVWPILLASIVWRAPAGAVEVKSLYEAQTIVTGQREETRIPGVKQCLLDVIVKVSGDQRLLSDPAMTAAVDDAGSFVSSFRYHDRLADRPIHDEQGTRDRPHDLTVDFEPARIDALLHALGRAPWSSNRPRLLVVVSVRQGSADYVLTRDGERGYSQRLALQAASDRIGVPVALPVQSAVTDVDQSTIQAAATVFERDGRASAADLPLAGRLVFDEAALGWIADWHLASGGVTAEWRIQGVSFDEAFRNGLRGAAQILSGHGQPG